MSFNPEREIRGFIFAVLNDDTELTTQTGIDKSSGDPRPVTIYNEVTQDAQVPYVRVTLTDTRAIEDEPFGYDFVPTANAGMLLVDVFSDFETEMFNIAARLKVLLQHKEITTAHYHGSTWFKSADFFVDNTTNPDRVLRRASIRVQANVEPLS
jgi:hypothetical protein